MVPLAALQDPPGSPTDRPTISQGQRRGIRDAVLTDPVTVIGL
jgi:hypothetical protein